MPLVDFRIDEEAGGELQVRGPWIARDYYDDDRRARSSPTTAGCAPATSPSCATALHPARRPHQGPGQVRRRVDLLGRARERDHGPPRVRRGRGDRGARREVGRAAVRVRRGQATARRSTPTTMRAFLDGRSRSGGCPSASCSSTRCPRPPSASSTRRSCAPGSPSPQKPPSRLALVVRGEQPVQRLAGLVQQLAGLLPLLRVAR